MVLYLDCVALFALHGANNATQGMKHAAQAKVLWLLITTVYTKRGPKGISQQGNLLSVCDPYCEPLR